jgi:outer membrane protein TolC
VSSQQAEEDRADEVNFELKQQYLRAQTSKKLYELYSKGVVPQASLALESSMSSYEVGNADFLTVLANFTSVLQYQVEYYQELVNYEGALARIEPLVGLDLSSASSQNPIAPENAKE